MARPGGRLGPSRTDRRERPSGLCIPARRSDQNPVPVFAPTPRRAFGGEHYPTHDPKRLKKGLKPEERLFDCPRWHLCLDTQTIHDRRWPRVPGARWVNYSDPKKQLASEAPESGVVPCQPSPATPWTARSCPSVQATLPLAESIRRALDVAVSQAQGDRKLRPRSIRRTPSGSCPACFPARTSAASSFKASTTHAFYLPTDEDGDGRLDHITIYRQRWTSARRGAGHRRACAGFGAADLELSLLLVGLGNEADFRHTREFSANRPPGCRRRRFLSRVT